MSKKVYAKARDSKGDPVRLCGILEDGANMVMVHICNGPRLGGFLLSRFENGRLTPKTLYNFFNQRPAQ